MVAFLRLQRGAAALLTLIASIEVAALTGNHLGKTIRRTFGRGFLDLLRDRRLEEARLLLRITDQPTTQIAFSRGFTDSNYFSTIFHHHTGLAPRDYRDREARQARR